MTYREIASKYQARYNRLNYGKQVHKLDYNEALSDISIAQMELANVYYLAEAETTLAIVDGTAVYTLPINTLSISLITFNDAGYSKCYNGSIERIRGQKGTGTPEYFMLNGQTLEFDKYPSGITSATITYCKRAEEFRGLANANTGTEYASLTDNTEILIPAKYSNLLVERALIETMPERYPIYEAQLKQILSARDFNFNGNLKDVFDSDGTERSPGEDTDR